MFTTPWLGSRSFACLQFSKLKTFQHSVFSPFEMTNNVVFTPQQFHFFIVLLLSNSRFYSSFCFLPPSSVARKLGGCRSDFLGYKSSTVGDLESSRRSSNSTQNRKSSAKKQKQQHQQNKQNTAAHQKSSKKQHNTTQTHNTTQQQHTTHKTTHTPTPENGRNLKKKKTNIWPESHWPKQTWPSRIGLSGIGPSGTWPKSLQHSREGVQRQGIQKSSVHCSSVASGCGLRVLSQVLWSGEGSRWRLLWHASVAEQGLDRHDCP